MKLPFVLPVFPAFALCGDAWFDSSASGTGTTELDIDRRRSLGRWALCCVALAAATAAAPMLVDKEDRRLRCLYVGEPSMTE